MRFKISIFKVFEQRGGGEPVLIPSEAFELLEGSKRVVIDKLSRVINIKELIDQDLICIYDGDTKTLSLYVKGIFKGALRDDRGVAKFL